MKARELRQHIADFATYNRSRNLSPKTIADYGVTLRRFFRYLDESEGLDVDLNPRCIRRFAADRLRKGNSPNTVRQYLVALRALFSSLVADEIVEEQANPMRLVKDPKPDPTQIRPLTDDEIRRLLGSFDKDRFTDHRNYTMCALVLDTGLRAGEITRVAMDDISLDKGRIKVQGKGRKRRTVFVGQKMRAILQDYISRLPEGYSALFPPNPPSRYATMGPHYFSEIVRKQMDKVGIARCRSSAHRLRHTFAVSFIKNGGDAFSLQGLLGHGSLEMTRRYVLLADGDLAESHRKASPMDWLDF